jgi:hypothetical protein
MTTREFLCSQTFYMNTKILKEPTAWIPIALSLAALVFVLGYLAIFGVVRQPDEGTPAHIWQLLMFLQAVSALFFIVKWLPRDPQGTLMMLALQIIAALAAFSPVYFLKL